jgi:uncharacterized cupin superfamily protein
VCEDRAVTGEARLRRTEHGLVPETDGWFVLNARDAVWSGNEENGRYTSWEGETRFAGLGINVAVLGPGQPACMYHGEDTQEDFLVLSGEALLVVEGEERALRAWDLVHCPPWTRHVIVGSGRQGCVVLAVGARPTASVLYPADETARRHGASVAADTTSPVEAYANTSKNAPVRYVEGDLPG